MIVVSKLNIFGMRTALLLVTAVSLLASAPILASGGGGTKNPPTVESPTFADVTATTATLGGTVTSDGGQPLSERGVVWNTSSPAETGGTIVIEGGIAVGTFTVAVSGLPSGTLIYFKAYATNGRGTSYSAESSFTTVSSAAPPTLDSSTLSSLASVTASTATLGGNITSDGNDPSGITERGTVWGLSSSPTGNQLAEGGTTTGSFSHLRTGLNTGTQIHFRSYATNDSGTSYGPNNNFYSEPATSPASATIDNVADTSFRINWPANPGGSGDGALVVVSTNTITGTPTDGVEHAFNSSYGAGGTVGSQQFVVYRGTGATSVTVTDLSPSTTYNVAVFYSAGTGSGETGINYRQAAPATNSQLTNTPAVAPTVDTPTIGTVTATTAVLGGTVSSDGGGAVTDRGIVWNTTSPAESGGTVVSEGSGLGLFTTLVSSLPPGTEIFFKAYATNSAGTAYSGELSFTTLVALPTVTVDPAASITSTSAFLGGTVTNDGGDPAGISERGTVWGTSPSPTGNALAEGGTTVGVPFSHERTGLPTGVTVYFRAYATNSAGTAYSADSSFIPSEPPILSSPTATNITYFSAVLGGTIDGDGGNPILSRGTVWNTTGTPVVENASPEGGTAIGTFSHTRFLPKGTTIYYRAYATSAVGTGYSPESSFITLNEPNVQASGITFTRIAARSLRIEWTRGNGEGSIVVVRTGAQVHPVDTTDYTANPDFTLGEDIGSGNIVVYKGSNDVVVVTGLTEETTYHVSIYEYAGTGVDTYYLGPPEQNPAENSAITTNVPVHNLDYGIDCNDCHNSHGEFLPRDAGQQVVCETCHNPSGQASGKLEFGLHLTPNKNPAVDFVDCGSCHELHNPGGSNTTEAIGLTSGTLGVNKSFLRANVEKYIPTAVPGSGSLQVDTYDAADPESALTPERAVEGGNDTTARGYCQVCHSLTNYHRSTNTAGADQCHDGESGNCGPAETNCGRCHQHNNRFIGVGGSQTCIECHQSAQGTRPIITAHFDRLSTHVAPGSLNEVDCEVCHDQGGHTGGQVTLWDADSHAQPSFQQPTAYASTIATGEGEAFAGHCLSCHDGDGALAEASPNSPFNGSSTPPALDETAWGIAGHNRPAATSGSSPVSCVGDGVNGCHGSGHGSEQLALLAPADTGPAISSTDFCFVCHDSDGPSLYNVQADFPDIPPSSSTEDPSNWRTTSGSGALVNQRHDILASDQAYSGGSVSCAGCHDPHADNSSNPVVDVVTGNPLNNYNPANYGGGADPTFGATEPDYIQFCLSCHDGTVPPGVTMSSGMLNIAATYTSDFHGEAFGGSGGNGFLKAPYQVDTAYAAMQCTDCHGAHGSKNIFNLRSSITINGTVMETGGWSTGKSGDIGFVIETDYTLDSAGGGVQEDHLWGAWCSFCHQMESHGVAETKTCTGGHMHGGGKM